MSARALLRASLLVAIPALVVTGCGGHKNQPNGAPVGDCENDCANGGGASGGGAGSGDGGVADATADADAAVDAGKLDVKGAIGRTLDDGFYAVGALAWQANVTAYGEATTAQVSTTTSGPSWSIDALAAGPTWFAITDAADAGKAPFLPTLMYADVEPTDTTIDLLAIDADVYTSALYALTPPQTIDTTKAQVVVTFRKGTKAVAGVQIPNGLGATVAYDAAPGYSLVSQGATATLTGGTALLINMPAQTFPGAVATFTFKTSAGASQAFSARVAAGYVTRLFVAL